VLALEVDARMCEEVALLVEGMGGLARRFMGLASHAIHVGYNLSGEFFLATSPLSLLPLSTWPSSHVYAML
jgi:hypothetical protein